MMNLIKWNNPASVFNTFDEMLENIRHDHHDYNHRQPAANILEMADGFKIELAVPGFSKEDVKIDLDKHVLSISADKKVEDAESKKNYTRREFSNSSFKRSFTLPKSIEVEKINAQFENGILFVDLPKKEQEIAIKKSIEIK